MIQKVIIKIILSILPKTFKPDIKPLLNTNHGHRKCKYCEYSSTDSKNMKRHIKFFHKLSKTCSCPYCGFKTGNEIEFKNQRRISYLIFIKKRSILEQTKVSLVSNVTSDQSINIELIGMFGRFTRKKKDSYVQSVLMRLQITVIWIFMWNQSIRR